jgi:electron transfer flavoprotein beta subunit
MKAKRKPIETIELASLGVEHGGDIKATHYAPPPKRSRGVMVKDVAELVGLLKQKGLV